MTAALLAVLCLCAGYTSAADDDKLDYLQPYKFVKPLSDLGNLYGPAAAAVADAEGGDLLLDNSELAVAESRLGEPAPTEPEAESEPEPEPEAEPQRSKSRYSQRRGDTGAAEDDEIYDDDIDSDVYAEPSSDLDQPIDRMSNHQTEVFVDDDVAEARKLVRLPPRPGDEYYYYYDDEYYYDDYLPLPPPPSPKPVKPRQSVKQRRPFSKPAIRPNREKSKFPPKKISPTTPEKKKEALKQKPKGNLIRKPQNFGRNTRRQYSIQSTINRLKGLKENQINRKGKPSPALPNPWKELKLSPLSLPKLPNLKLGSKPETTAAPKKKVVKVAVPDDYYDDYYYDYQPLPKPQKNRRQETGVLGGANPLALLVAPLAGIALLTAAAAVAINPVLVTVSLTGKRRRRRRSAESEDEDVAAGYDFDEGISPELEEKIHEMQVLEKFMASIPENVNYQHQVLSMYLSCSGYTEVSNKCIDRVVCEYADSNSDISSEERDVISIVLYNIMINEFVSAEYKDRLRDAAKHGRDHGTCMVYECDELSRISSNSLSK